MAETNSSDREDSLLGKTKCLFTLESESRKSSDPVQNFKKMKKLFLAVSHILEQPNRKRLTTSAK